MTSTWQHTDNARLAGLPALASAAAAAEEEVEPEQLASRPEAQERRTSGDIQALRVDSKAQSDPIEPQPTPFEAFTQAPLAAEKPVDGVPPAAARLRPNDIRSSTESSAMRLSLLSAAQPPSDAGRSVSIRSGGGAGSIQASCSISDSFAHGRSLESSAPTDGSGARSVKERNAQLLGFLQKNHLLETSQVSLQPVQVLPQLPDLIESLCTSAQNNNPLQTSRFLFARVTKQEIRVKGAVQKASLPACTLKME